MSDQNWRTDTNAQDYFGHQKKQIELADRRPVIRKPSDLVGPGIAANAVRITDFNDHLATYDGFFAAAVGALNAPNGEPLAGTVTSDSGLGGVQMFAGLTTGATYQRVFNRNPSDAATVYWGDWIVVADGSGGSSFLETLPVSIIDAKGDLIVGVSDNVAMRKAVGADGQSLVADSSVTGGVSWDQRVKSIVPGANVAVDSIDPANPIVSVLNIGAEQFINTDVKVVTGPGTVTFTLSFIPVDGSLHVHWNADYQPPTEWTLVGKVLTIPDPDNLIESGDAFTAAYVYAPDGQPVPETINLRGQTANLDHWAIPGSAVVGDLLVIVGMVPSAKTPALNGWTLVGDSGSVTHGTGSGSYTYRMTVMTKIYDGTSTVPTIVATGTPQALCLMVALNGGARVEAVFDTLADGLTANTPAGFSSMRAWGALSNLGTITPSAGTTLSSINASDIDLTVTEDDNFNDPRAATSTTTAGWCLATLAVYP